MIEMTLSSRHIIRALAVYGRARYLMVTKAPHIYFTMKQKRHHDITRSMPTPESGS